MKTLVKFCYVCKKHVTVNSDADFWAQGHDGMKVKKLLPGLVGKPPVSRG